MSYILDALRRSQAERERGQVPGLNARPAAVAALPEGPRGGPWRWPAALLAALLLGALLWWAWPKAPPAPAATLPATAAVPPNAAPRVLAQPARPAPPPAAELPQVVSAPVNTPPVVVAPPAPAATPPVVAAQPPAPPPATPPVAAAAARPAPAAAPPKAVLLSALTAEQRRELPSMVMGGSIWSDNALGRFVIVNGQVVREGELAAPGVVVERIGPKAVWLRWRELKLELPL